MYFYLKDILSEKKMSDPDLFSADFIVLESQSSTLYIYDIFNIYIYIDI